MDKTELADLIAVNPDWPGLTEAQTRRMVEDFRARLAAVETYPDSIGQLAPAAFLEWIEGLADNMVAAIMATGASYAQAVPTATTIMRMADRCGPGR